jgi:hypothetical protein
VLSRTQEPVMATKHHHHYRFHAARQLSIVVISVSALSTQH